MHFPVQHVPFATFRQLLVLNFHEPSHPSSTQFRSLNNTTFEQSCHDSKGAKLYTTYLYSTSPKAAARLISRTNPTMPSLPTSQQSDWSNNIYVVATTRIFVMIGMAYLAKSLYNFVPSIWGTRSASIAAGEYSSLPNPHQGQRVRRVDR